MPEEPAAKRTRGRRWIRRALLVGLVLFLPLGYGLWYHLLRKVPPQVFASDEDCYKYGSLGLAPGFPLYLWHAMPELFPDKLPGGWAAFGLTTEPGHDTPVGFSKQTVGFPGLLPNCALCHAGTVRPSSDAPRQLVLGSPSTRLDFDAFNNAVFACAADPRFTPANLLAKIETQTSLGWFERNVYRFIILPATKAKLLEARHDAAWQASRPTPGCGRTDAFNRFKINLLGLADDGSLGTSDYPPLWNQSQRVGLWLHWNGSGNALVQENLLSVLPVIGIGNAKTFQPATFARVTNFLWNLKPPKFPLAIDPALAARGQEPFNQHCARCHAWGAEQVGQVTALAEIGTDPRFLEMWTEAFVSKLESIDHPPFRFDQIRRTNGFVNPPLDGLWLRAPYLHNGSVPTLWDLLQSPERRPASFVRGYDVLDAAKVGFISQGPEAERAGFRYDTRLPGNSNQGHRYGVELPEADKRALIEFLKTL